MIAQVCVPMYSTGPYTRLNHFLLSRVIEIFGNSGDCKEAILQFGFKLDNVIGKTVSIRVLQPGHDGTFSALRIPFTIPKDLNSIWRER